MDQAAYLQHLQTVLCKFNTDAIILEPALICLFRNSLRLFFCAQAKDEGRQKDT